MDIKIPTETPPLKRRRGRPPGFKLQPPPIDAKARLALSPRAERDIVMLARDTKIEITQVLEDVITNGLIQTRGMYSEVIQARKDLEKLRNEYRQRASRIAEQQDGRLEEANHNGIEGPGDAPVEFDQGLRPKFDDADVERGQQETQLTHSESSGSVGNLVEPIF